MLSNVSLLFSNYNERNRKKEDFLLTKNQKSFVSDYFLSNNNILTINKVTFTGLPQKFQTIREITIRDTNNIEIQQKAKIVTNSSLKDAYKTFYVFLGEKKLGEMKIIERLDDIYGVAS